jgi:hypothetical protein
MVASVYLCSDVKYAAQIQESWLEAYSVLRGCLGFFDRFLIFLGCGPCVNRGSDCPLYRQQTRIRVRVLRITWGFVSTIPYSVSALGLLFWMNRDSGKGVLPAFCLGGTSCLCGVSLVVPGLATHSYERTWESWLQLAP